MRRVAITGIGAICGNGERFSDAFAAMRQGVASRMAISEEAHFDVRAHPRPYESAPDGPITTVCGVRKTNRELAECAVVDKAQRFDRHQLFALIAAEEALHDAHPKGPLWFAWQEHRFGIAGGTGDGGLSEVHAASLKLAEGKKLDPAANLRELPNIFVGHIANRYGIKGPSFVHATACAASAHGFMQAVAWIQMGLADAFLVVGAEAAICPFGIGSFASQRALSNESRPYQKGRSGFLMGEGAAALVVEALPSALARGAHVYAEVAGYCATTDGKKGALITDPDADGGTRAALGALSAARITALDIGYVNTHGTGTPTGDVEEVKGLTAWMGSEATHILVSSTKSYTGHLLGAAGALELALTAKMVSERMVLPTYGLTNENMDPACGGVLHVTGESRALNRDYAMSNSFGFGGTNASVVLKRFLPK